jgi:hypothetical protein
LWCRGAKIIKITFFGMPPPLKIIITFVPCKLQSTYGASLKANEILFSEIYNSHLDRVVLVSLSPDVTFDL